jgi:hypothetical protein
MVVEMSALHTRRTLLPSNIIIFMFSFRGLHASSAVDTEASSTPDILRSVWQFGHFDIGCNMNTSYFCYVRLLVLCNQGTEFDTAVFD